MGKSCIKTILLTFLVVSGVMTTPEGFAQDLTTGLEGYWNFDEGTGTTSTDQSGNNRDATVRNGSPIWTAGKIGNAIYFGGSDDMTVPWKGIAGSTPRTVSFWVKSTDQATHGIVSWGLSTANGGKWHTRINNNESNGTLGAFRTEVQGNFYISSTPVHDGEWHHVVSMFPEGGSVMTDVIHYVDGVLDPMSGTNTGGSDILIDTVTEDEGTDVTIGSRIQGTANHFFTGAVDEVRIYSRALTAEEIQALYEQGNVTQISAERSFGDSSVLTGESVTVTLTLQGSGEGVLTETLPDGWAASNASNGGTISGNTITWNITPDIPSVSYDVSPEVGADGFIFQGNLDGIITSGSTRLTVVQEESVGDFSLRADIGTTGAESEAFFSNGTYEITAAGADIESTQDNFHFVFNEMNGSFSISATLYPLDISGNDTWTKVGLMIRDNLTPGSPNAFLMIRSDLQIRTQMRIDQDGATTSTSLIATANQLGEVRLERIGNTINSYYLDLDGNEVLLDSTVFERISDPVYVGLAVTGNNSSGITSTGEFTNVEIEEYSQSATRAVTFSGTGDAGPGDTLDVTIHAFVRGGSVTITENPPQGWTVSEVTFTQGDASADANGVVTWNLSGVDGEAQLTYKVTAPVDQLEGMFSGTIGADSIIGDEIILLKGLLPDEILDQQDITSGLQAHWSFDEGTGTEFADASGNDYTLRVRNGDPTFGDGVQGSAIVLNGDDNLDTDWKGLSGNASRTISVWINAQSNGALVTWGNSNANGQKWHVRLNTTAGDGTVGAVRTEIQGNYLIGSTPVHDGQWHHVVSVFPEGGSVMTDVIHYVNGNREAVTGTNEANASIVINTVTDDAGTNVIVGGRIQGANEEYYPDGMLDEVRIYDRGLTVEEVQKLYVTERPETVAVIDFMIY